MAKKPKKREEKGPEIQDVLVRGLTGFRKQLDKTLETLGLHIIEHTDSTWSWYETGHREQAGGGFKSWHEAFEDMIASIRKQ